MRRAGHGPFVKLTLRPSVHKSIEQSVVANNPQTLRKVMRNTGISTMITSTRRLAKAGLMALAVGLGSFSLHAGTVTVFTDPNDQFYGYENVYTNGLNST